MTHPTHEDWMSFLYGEDSPDQRRELETHLQTCAGCAARLETWRLGAKTLDEWRLPADRPPAGRGPVWKWAAAAALLLGAGIVLGRLAAPAGPDPAALRASLLQEIDQKLVKARTDLLAEWRQSRSDFEPKLLATARETAAAETRQWMAGHARAMEDQWAADQEILVGTLRQLDSRFATRLALLRKELETVAVNTQEGFSETEQRLGQLASFKQNFNPSPP